MRILIFILAMFFCGCTSPGASWNALDDMGFKEIETGGYDLFACGKDYVFHTKFKAKNPNGKIVSGVVCCGWLKGCSIKF